MDQDTARALADACGRAGFRATTASHGFGLKARYVVRVHPAPDRPAVELAAPADWARLRPQLEAMPVDPRGEP